MKRQLLKTCFKKSLYGAVVYDVWLLIIEEIDSSVTIRRVSCLSRGFQCLVKDASGAVLRKALECRKNTEILLARHFLLKAATVFENTDAMVHLGNACIEGGWKQRTNPKESFEWLEKAAQRGSKLATALYISQTSILGKYHIKHRRTYYNTITDDDDDDLGQLLIDWYVIDPDCYSAKRSVLKLLIDFAQNNDNEFLQCILGWQIEGKEGIDWFRKAAEQGSYQAMKGLSFMYDVCSDPVFLIWQQKAAQQEI